MNIIQFLFFFNLLSNYLAPNAKYLLIQVNDEETKNDLDAPKKTALQSRDSRIIGGSEIRKHSQPWLALLCYDNVREGCNGGCAGSLIAPRFVLTAAHCDNNGMGYGFGSNHRYVLLGAHHKFRFTGSEKFIKIQRWITHPNARDFQNHKPYGKWITNILYYDYSLLLLAKKVKYTNNIRPIALPANSDQDYTGKYLITSGWGNTRILLGYDGKLTDDFSSDVPKKTIVQAIEHNHYRCKAKGYSNMCEHCGLASVICTYGKRRYNRTIVNDACRGDSGGPLFMNDGRTEPTLVGVVSFGSSCGQIESPAVFSKVDHVLNWIHKTMSKYN